VNHAELQSLLGAFALDAVDPAEAELIEAHLAECPRCRAEVAEYRETAALLASGGSDAPAGLWDRIASDLDESPPPLRLHGTSASPRRTAHRGRMVALMAAAAVVLFGLGGLFVRVQHLDHEVVAMRRPLQSQGIDEAALAALVDPAARRVTLRAGTGSDRADAVVLPDGRGFLVHSDLPPLPASMTYQLWGVVGGHLQVSLGLLGASPTTTAFRFDPATVSLLAITAEQSGGVAATDHPAVVSAPLIA